MGTLYMVIEEAKLTRDTEMFSKMDPYCKVKYMGKKYKTQTKDEAGKKPVWRYKMELYVKDMNEEIEFKVMDQDNLTSDFVGGHICRVKDIIAKSDAESTRELKLTYGDKSAG